MEKVSDGRTDCHARVTLSNLHQFHLTDEYWNVQLLVDSTLFKCQRSLLAATCEYFDTMFKSRDFKESETIILHELAGEAAALEEILHYLYTGDVRVNGSNVLHLLFLSGFLGLRSDVVKEECLRFLNDSSVEFIFTSNALHLLRLARSKKEIFFVKNLSVHIFGHMYHFSKDARLMDVSFENLKALLVRGKEYILPLSGSSDALLAIIHNWVNWNREEREQYRGELIGCIDSSTVSSGFASKLETLDTEVDIDDIDGDARLHAFVTFKVENISEMERGEIQFSPSCIVSNLSWKTRFEWYEDGVDLSLECEATDGTPKWRCYANVILTVKSLKEGTEDLRIETGDSILTSGTPIVWIWNNSLFRDLLNREKGFIGDDDSITLDIHIYAGLPCIEGSQDESSNDYIIDY